MLKLVLSNFFIIMKSIFLADFILLLLDYILKFINFIIKLKRCFFFVINCFMLNEMKKNRYKNSMKIIKNFKLLIFFILKFKFSKKIFIKNIFFFIKKSFFGNFMFFSLLNLIHDLIVIRHVNCVLNYRFLRLKLVLKMLFYIKGVAGERKNRYKNSMKIIKNFKLFIFFFVKKIFIKNIFLFIKKGFWDSCVSNVLGTGGALIRYLGHVKRCLIDFYREVRRAKRWIKIIGEICKIL